MNDSPEHKSIFMRWWFWVIFVLLIAGTWYVKGYIEWRAATSGDTTYNALSQQYWNYLKGRSDALEQQYRNDNYGGETPEETLRLFVEALEAKDAVLASKYFIPESQETEEADLKELISNRGENGYMLFVNAYKKGRVVPPSGVGSSGIYEIEVFPPNETVAFGVRLIENPFTNKWKILEL